jgi:hypothetical protein
LEAVYRVIPARVRIAYLPPEHVWRRQVSVVGISYFPVHNDLRYVPDAHLGLLNPAGWVRLPGTAPSPAGATHPQALVAQRKSTVLTRPRSLVRHQPRARMARWTKRESRLPFKQDTLRVRGPSALPFWRRPTGRATACYAVQMQVRVLPPELMPVSPNRSGPRPYKRDRQLDHLRRRVVGLVGQR